MVTAKCLRCAILREVLLLLNMLMLLKPALWDAWTMRPKEIASNEPLDGARVAIRPEHIQLICSGFLEPTKRNEREVS